MLAAEDDFDWNGRKLRAGAFIIPNADRAKLEPEIRDLGLSAWAVSAAPTVKTHELKVPRIGYVHSWTRPQDEGWVRAALDHYGVPYTYFADQKLAEGDLRAKYDVIVFPHVGGTLQAMINGLPKTGSTPLPYKKTPEFPNLGAIDSSDDIRGGIGFHGMMELGKFVSEGGTLITEGSTASLMAEYVLSSGVTVEHPESLFARGSILRGVFSDLKSPIAYGYEGKDLPLYFNQDPVFNVGGAGLFGGGSAAAVGQVVTPNAEPIHISPLEPPGAPPTPKPASPAGRGGRGGAGGGGRGGFAAPTERPRVVLHWPSNVNDMLLSGTLAGGEALSGRAAAVDVSLGKGHIVMFALRPFWRWQTHGTYMLAFNAILNWDHLDAGKPERPAAPATGAGQ
jgi:hypothetical protein